MTCDGWAKSPQVDLRSVEPVVQAQDVTLTRGWTSCRAAHVPDGLADLEASVARHLKTSCRAVGFRRKGRKLLVEFELAADDVGATLRRCIAKVYPDDRGQNIFDAQSQLWAAGLRPPSPYTVACPVAYIAEHHLLLQEKAPGRPVANVLFEETDQAPDTLVGTARWLARLHAAAVQAQPRLDPISTAVARYGVELMELLPRYARRIERLVASALSQLEPRYRTRMVPSHGDLHPENLFVAADGRMTAIDPDKFGLQEQAADVAYFLSQTAIMGYFHQGNFSAALLARDCFLRAYEEIASPLPRERLALYLGIAFLQSLHYELWALDNGRTYIIEPWLANSERGLLGGELMLV